VTDNISKLTDVNREPNPRLIEALEGLVGEAKSGRLRGVFVIKNYADCYGRLSAGEWSYCHIVYGLELYKRRVLQEAEADG
jgi:hypothetical protein